MKIKMIIFISAVLLALSSCASAPKSIYPIINNSEEDFVDLRVFRYTAIQRIDNILLNCPAKKRHEIVRIPTGQHTFYVRYESGDYYAQYYIPVTGQFEKGNTYFLKFSLKWSITYSFYLYEERQPTTDITNYKSTEDQIILPFYYRYFMYPEQDSTVKFEPWSIKYSFYLYNDRQQTTDITIKSTEDQFILPFYSSHLMQPAQQGGTVRLENNKYVLVYRPNNIYSFTEKENGRTIEGSYRFYTALSEYSAEHNGKVFLFDEILPERQINRRKANTVLIPIKATKTEVIYLYQKPIELFGTEIRFNITGISYY